MKKGSPTDISHIIDRIGMSCQIGSIDIYFPYQQEEWYTNDPPRRRRRRSCGRRCISVGETYDI